MIVRNAKLKDLDKCAKISHIPEFTQLKNASDKEAKDYLKEFYYKGIFVVAEDNNKIVGFIIGELMLGSVIWIDGLTVKEEHRGKGIGKLLCQKFKSIQKEKKIKHTYLMAPKFNKNTINFYKSIGMKKGSEFVEFSEDIF